MCATRVAAFIDGFNLYHAIDDLGRDELKWLDLRALARHFAPAPGFSLHAVCYFSAYATWLLDPYKRHRTYCAALSATGVNVVLGKFKERPRRCWRCRSQWADHEEKESDVNIAIHMVRAALRNECDRLLLITRDSDLAPVVRMIRRECPEKELRVVTPVGREHSLPYFPHPSSITSKSSVYKLWNAGLSTLLSHAGSIVPVTYMFPPLSATISPYVFMATKIF